MTADQLPHPGQIGLTIASGRNDEDSKVIWQRDLQTDLARLKHHYGVDRLVCLLGSQERSISGPQSAPHLDHPTTSIGLARVITTAQKFGGTNPSLRDSRMSLVVRSSLL